MSRLTITESQLETWSHSGAVVTAQATHESVRKALVEGILRERQIDYEVYLQGSYRNTTNIRGDSDVDIVAQLNSSFRSDTSQLPESESAAWQAAYRDSTYGWTEF